MENAHKKKNIEKMFSVHVSLLCSTKYIYGRIYMHTHVNQYFFSVIYIFLYDQPHVDDYGEKRNVEINVCVLFSYSFVFFLLAPDVMCMCRWCKLKACIKNHNMCTHTQPLLFFPAAPPPPSIQPNNNTKSNSYFSLSLFWLHKRFLCVHIYISCSENTCMQNMH